MMKLETSFNFPLKKNVRGSEYDTKQPRLTNFNLNSIENPDSIIENAQKNIKK